MKNFLFILRNPAHSGAYAQETLDIILTAAAFDQAVSLLLLDDGVWQLKTQQNPEKAGLKDTAAIFKALELYDVQDIYAEAESLNERGLQADDLILPTTLVPRADVGVFIGRFAVVFAG
ncbi:hypothetical protein JCM14076_00350 [Methylosoma difficile]